MRVRKLALAVGLVSALGGNAALALGLGEIKLNSTLNQPLNAEIGLLQTRDLGDSEIKVRLASPDDFERAGVDRSYLLTELRFEVDYSGAKPVIRISSREPIREPFLNFLVETRWPSGRLLREYTLLMDLPAFSNSTAQQPVRAAERERQQVRRDAPQPQRRPLQPTTTRPAQPEATEQEQVQVRDVEETRQPEAGETVELRSESRPATASETAGGSQVYGPVSADQTLWEIALQNRVGREFSVQQTMLAIQRLNPEAFINDNINLLKKGAVLRLPNAEEVRALTLTEAISEVATQNDSWRQRVGGDAATGAPLDARAASETLVESESVEGRVSLAAPGDNESVTSGSGSGAEDSEALAGELTVTEEELDKSELENAELKDRISELDEQIDTMERLVEVSNEEMQAVQAAAEQAEPLPATEGGEVAADPASEQVETAAEEAPAEAAAPQETPVAPEEEPAEEANRNRVVVQTKPEPTLMDQVMDNIQLIGIGAGALLVGLFAFFTWRRRKEEEEAMRQVEAEMAAERALAEAPEHAEVDENLAAVESMEVEDSFDMGQLGDDVGTDDPVSEAEIHLSLGQHDEAESKLLAGLQQDGQNVDARLMLLEVYAHRQDVGQFDDHYRQLLTISDGPVADRAARLRESIAGAVPFEAPEMDFTSESLEATQLDDIGASFEDELSGDHFSSGSVDSSSEQEALSLLDDLTMDLADDSEPAAQSSGDDFSFDLELDSGLEAGSAKEQEADTSADDDFNLDDLMSGDLDLNGLDLDSGDSAGGEGADSSDDFASIDFDAGELELDIGMLEGGEDTTSLSAETDGSEDDGLDFDLDLSPMEDSDGGDALPLDTAADAGAEPAPQVSAAPASDDLDSDDDFGDDFGGLGEGLDLDSIDLDDIASDLSSAEELSAAESEQGVAVAEEPVPVQPAAAAPASATDGESDFGDLSFNLESDLDSELNLLEGSDEVSTKLELAQAYLDMGDKDGAKDILHEVVEEGSGEHKSRAQEMLERMS